MREKLEPNTYAQKLAIVLDIFSTYPQLNELNIGFDAQGVQTALTKAVKEQQVEAVPIRPVHDSAYAFANRIKSEIPEITHPDIRALMDIVGFIPSSISATMGALSGVQSK